MPTRCIPHPSRTRQPQTPARSRRSPQRQGREALLTGEIPAYPRSARKRPARPVTPKVACSSPVAPVKPCKLARLLPTRRRWPRAYRDPALIPPANRRRAQAVARNPRDPSAGRKTRGQTPTCVPAAAAGLRGGGAGNGRQLPDPELRKKRPPRKDGAGSCPRASRRGPRGMACRGRPRGPDR
jgi:hypothetical protein